jgi:broad specificity phosphatase PhoE
MKHLYFIRHGKSEMNMLNIFSGHTDSPLSAEGIEQAKKAGKAAKHLHIDHIISSPLSRAHDTAKYIAQEIGFPAKDVELNSLLIERNFGSMEGQPWSPDFNMDGVADAETFDSLQQRAVLVWEYLQTIPAENILIVSHGSTGRMLRNVINPDIPFSGGGVGHHFPNAAIVQLI